MKEKFIKWLNAAGIRAIKTMAQTALSSIVIGAFNETIWGYTIQITLISGVASVLTSVAGLPELKNIEEE